MDRLLTFTTRILGMAMGEYFQYTVFTIITLLVSLSALIANSSVPSAYQRYLGGIHPLLMILILYILGMLMFSVLMREGAFAVFRRGDYKGILTAAALTIPFALVVTIVDINWPFPEDMNVPFPNSIFFYASIGYIVEILLHLLPFGLLYILLGKLFPGTEGGWIVWVCILGAAILEPALQVVFAGSSDLPGIPVFVGVHLLLINLVQLILFVKFDFLSMYSFRLVYYLWWHVIWGYLRLGVVFQ